MARTGVHVKALENRPELIDVDEFYRTMFNSCKSDLLSIVTYCDLYGFTSEETVEAIEVMQIINYLVSKNANS